MYKTFKILDEASARTVLMRNTPVPDFDVPSCLLRPPLFYLEIQQRCSVLRESAFDENALAAERNAAQSFHRVSIIDLVDDFCNESICPAKLNGIVVYEDTDHISNDFARSLSAELARRLVPLISEDKSLVR
jgi:SGNH domain (fused to AT3 domains)